MTANRVVTDHKELCNSGQVTHSELDNYVNTTPWLVVSGTAGAIPSGSRRLVAGPGIIITDTGPGGNLIISASAASSGSTIQWMEVPSGSNDGTNRDFSLIYFPTPSGSLMFYIGGVLQSQGPMDDYVVISGSMIHINHKYKAGQNMKATYPY